MSLHNAQRLVTIMYHYIRDVKGTEFPHLRAMGVDAFQAQVSLFSDLFEMATLESALAFIQGDYLPKRDLCLLTFDDGLIDHFDFVTPILSEKKIQGVFFISTSCIEDRRVLAVHKSHFLMGFLGFEKYRDLFMKIHSKHFPEIERNVDETIIYRTYKWDTPNAAKFKYFINYILPKQTREWIVNNLFEKVIGDETKASKSIYLNWEHAREMQKNGMIIGGHTHTHQVLSYDALEIQEEEIRTCYALSKANLFPQSFWPFAYPYGKQDTFNYKTIKLLKSIGYSCAFCTEIAKSSCGEHFYRIPRIDPKDAPSFKPFNNS